MRCENCRFYMPTPEYEWKGVCAIKLPPQYEQSSESCSRNTRADNECDLGQAKQVEAKE